MENSVGSLSLNPPVLSLPDTPTTTNLISVVMDKFQGTMSAKETTLNLQKETLQTIVDDMNLMSDKLDALKDTSNWDSASKPFDDPLLKELIGIEIKDPRVNNNSEDLIAINAQLKSAGFKLEPPNAYYFSYIDPNSQQLAHKTFANVDKKWAYSDYLLAKQSPQNYRENDIFYFDDKPGSEGVKTYFSIYPNGVERVVVDAVDFQPFRVPLSQAELSSWNEFGSSIVLSNPYKYPFSDLVGLPVTNSKVTNNIQNLISANNELRSAGMTLGPPNVYYGTGLTSLGSPIQFFDKPPIEVPIDIVPSTDGFYAIVNTAINVGPGTVIKTVQSYLSVSNGVVTRFGGIGSVRIPKSQDELTAWNNFIAFKQSSISSDKIFKDPILLASKNVNSDINANFNMAFVKQVNTTSSPYAYSITAVSPENKSSQPKGTFFYLTDDIKNPKTYYLSSGSGAPTVVPASDISLFIKNPSDGEIQSWRTQYAEKQIQLTQRSTEFQAFLNTTVAEFNTYSDLFTNVLKTIFTSLRDIASRL